MTIAKVIRAAYGSVPKESGTFTFFRNHRAAFAEWGVDLRCVTIGRDQAELWNPEFADDHCVLLAPNATSIKHQAEAFVDWCVAESIDIVIPVNSPGMICALPHLPASLRIVARCANAFAEGYEFSVASLDRVSRIVALTPRLRDDLIADYGVRPEQIAMIPNGVDTTRFDQPRTENANGRLELGFLGRLEHNQKGVLYLPQIVATLADRNVNFRLRIAGTGIHEQQLQQELAEPIVNGQVEMLGLLPADQVAAFLNSVDIYLFTSHFEGCPNALLEAMAAGCVPASWIIPGITDFIISTGQTGELVNSGDCLSMGQRIVRLDRDRQQLAQMGNAARRAAAERFSVVACAAAYVDVFRSSLETPDPITHPLPWHEFRPPVRFQQRLGWLPNSVRQWLKNTSRRLRS